MAMLEAKHEEWQAHVVLSVSGTVPQNKWSPEKETCNLWRILGVSVDLIDSPRKGLEGQL